MAIFSPDTYVLIAPSGADRSRRPPWPAVVCRDKEVPKRMLNDRSNTFVIPVLLLQKLELRWVLPGDILVLDHLAPPESANKWPGLKIAYQDVCHAYQHGLGYAHWLAVRRANNELNDVEEAYAVEQRASPLLPNDEDVDDDAGLAMAIKASLEDIGRNKTVSPRPFSDTEDSSPPSPRIRSTLKRGRPNSESSFQFMDNDTTLLPSPSRSGDSPAKTVASQRRSNEHGRMIAAASFKERKMKRPRIHDDTLEGSSRGEPNNEEVEEEASSDASAEEDENEGLVCFSIGRDPNQGKYVIPEENIRSKAYFVAPHLSFLQPVGKRLRSHVFVRPCLRDIDPEDFKHVADYLSTDDFGHRVIEDEDQRAESVEECYKAWNIAQELGMWDLMAKIVEKMTKAQPWQMEEVLAFSALVYDTPLTVLPDHDDMRDLLANHIAEHYWAFVGEHTTTFAELMKKCPALEFDVLERRTETLRQTVDAVEDEIDEEGEAEST
ncbi:hypothetical protein K491DRAFT_713935 [Lophiostoma macrostomum CBS 122681]|uniref:PWWP domain-containing protein n=1 Tax=Lophiostoma macrostomum CBS 122681 TaxID=1314788 RepID=A0A6A6TEV4_9PLEO|nr:hypothetical protein K491DRAFT_713935 [Lophiostoma macrostomum CBS 122681]